MKTILPSDIWIADLLFLRQNRSLIYTENGLSSILFPMLISLVLSASSLFTIIKQRKELQQIFGKAYFNDLISFILLFFIIVCIDFIAKIGIFIELLYVNFSIRIAAEDEDFTLKIEAFFAKLFELSHWLLQLSPLFHSLFCLFGVSFYRSQLYSILQKLFFCKQHCFCHNSKLDYSSETLRSILAEQTKKRQMNRNNK
uniref:G_PROTEIN_RECEP_F1_2 domain-containing protein n=1 Tax=Meloidogyne hapla TaxID=6305 RepID=A0A1I8BLB0_MELHA